MSPYRFWEFDNTIFEAASRIVSISAVSFSSNSSWLPRRQTKGRDVRQERATMFHVQCEKSNWTPSNMIFHL